LDPTEYMQQQRLVRCPFSMPSPLLERRETLQQVGRRGRGRDSDGTRSRRPGSGSPAHAAAVSDLLSGQTDALVLDPRSVICSNPHLPLSFPAERTGARSSTCPTDGPVGRPGTATNSVATCTHTRGSPASASRRVAARPAPRLVPVPRQRNLAANRLPTSAARARVPGYAETGCLAWRPCASCHAQRRPRRDWTARSEPSAGAKNATGRSAVAMPRQDTTGGAWLVPNGRVPVASGAVRPTTCSAVPARVAGTCALPTAGPGYLRP
jgi:hypothetical protein